MRSAVLDDKYGKKIGVGSQIKKIPSAFFLAPHEFIVIEYMFKILKLCC